MSERLNREAVERSIREMWDALIDQVDATDPDAIAQLDTAKDEARQCEARLRARLDAQDRLDAAAPALLEACKQALAAMDAEKRFQAKGGQSVIFEIGVASATLDKAIALAEGTHEKQDS